MLIISKCIITFSSFQKKTKNKSKQRKKKNHQIFILDNYLMSYLFCFDWDVANMQFTRELVGSYLLNCLKGKQSSSCMVISLDSAKVLCSLNGFQKAPTK